MKIIFIIDGLLTGGAEKSTLDIVSRLPDHIIPLVVVVYKHHDLKPEFEKAGIRLIYFDLEGKYEFKRGIKLFTKVCIQEKPDLIVATLFRSEIISRIVSYRLKIPNVGTFVSDTYSSNALLGLSLMMKLKIGTFWFLNRATISLCSHLLANSNSVKRSNAKKLLINDSKIDVIYRGRKVDDFQFNIDGRFALEELKFLNVGRLLKSKGQKELIIAFAKFVEVYPKASLQIAGEGVYRAELEATITSLKLNDKVTLLGSVKNVPELLTNCDVFIFPSYYEGFSGALVEAMLTGAPILASDISMNKEAIDHLNTGYLFKVKNVSSLFEAMLFAVNNKEKMKKMAIKARNIAEIKYDIDNIASQHAMLYQKYVSGNHNF
jgi:glycosyltransferase involved in cell wall biosynthesis